MSVDLMRGCRGTPPEASLHTFFERTTMRTQLIHIYVVDEIVIKQMVFVSRYWNRPVSTSGFCS